MKYSITFLQEDFDSMKDSLFEDQKNESACYLLCSESVLADEVKLLVKEIIPIKPSNISSKTASSISIKSISYMRVMKAAKDKKCSFIFVHTHPKGFNNFSAQDMTMERQLFTTAYNRIGRGYHGSLVLTEDSIKGRIWENDLSHVEFSKVRILGDMYKILIDDNNNYAADIFSRQVTAFGVENQKILAGLSVGIVGCGGTGSSVAAQLARMGVGELILIDDDRLEESNISRLYFSSIGTVGEYKTDVLKRGIIAAGLKTKVTIIREKITKMTAAEKIKNCDIIFGCTDDHSGRGILNNLAYMYYVPVIDMAVKVDSKDQKIKSVVGRISVILPGSACSLCRKDISQLVMRAESLNEHERIEQVGQGYIPELNQTDPSVISFTTNISSFAVSEMLDLITNFSDRKNSPNHFIILYGDYQILKTNRRGGSTECGICGNAGKIFGTGDSEPFLGLAW